MHTMNPNPPATSQRGVALIIALILLMVLTMIAVVAMRTTTLDLKMSSNQTVQKRTFQISEAGRARIHDVLDDHSFFGGWPVSITNGTVPASKGFTIPSDIAVDNDPAQILYLTDNAESWDLRPAAIDMQLLVDVDGDAKYESTYDMAANVFVSHIDTFLAPGSDTAMNQGSGGFGGGAAAAGSRVYYRIIAQAAGVGASQAITEAVYRYVVQ